MTSQAWCTGATHVVNNGQKPPAVDELSHYLSLLNAAPWNIVTCSARRSRPAALSAAPGVTEMEWDYSTP